MRVGCFSECLFILVLHSECLCLTPMWGTRAACVGILLLICFLTVVYRTKTIPHHTKTISSGGGPQALQQRWQLERLKRTWAVCGQVMCYSSSELRYWQEQLRHVGLENSSGHRYTHTRCNITVAKSWYSKRHGMLTRTLADYESGVQERSQPSLDNNSVQSPRSPLTACRDSPKAIPRARL